MLKQIGDIFSTKSHQSGQQNGQNQHRRFDFSDTFDFFALIQNWPKIIGAQLAQSTIPLRINHQSLIILTKHGAYATELKFMGEKIIENILRYYPSLRPLIKNIKFQTNPQFFKNLDETQKLVQKRKTIQLNKFHPQSPKYQQALHQAQQEFANVEDIEIKNLLISIHLQQSQRQQD